MQRISITTVERCSANSAFKNVFDDLSSSSRLISASLRTVEPFGSLLKLQIQLCIFYRSSALEL